MSGFGGAFIFLVAALADAGDPLPANSEANVRLQTVAANLEQPPAAPG